MWGVLVQSQHASQRLVLNVLDNNNINYAKKIWSQMKNPWHQSTIQVSLITRTDTEAYQQYSQLHLLSALDLHFSTIEIIELLRWQKWKMKNENENGSKRSLPAVLLVTAPQGMSVAVWGNPTSMECKVSRLHQPAYSQHAHYICLVSQENKDIINFLFSWKTLDGSSTAGDKEQNRKTMFCTVPCCCKTAFSKPWAKRKVTWQGNRSLIW